ncbi:MAG: phosphopentomutase, partial [Bacilli bacterium]|nr:phosphopentomutase [Bacilli bacterium]
MNKYKRLFVIVIDSVGIGEMPDAEKFGDRGANTLVHTAREVGGLKVPVMNSLGLGDLAPILGTSIVNHPHSYALRLRETSAGKDTMTGHWEMMGINTTTPFQTFTDT